MINTVKNKFARWYKSGGVKIVTIPANTLIIINSKPYGTKKDNINTVITYVNNPNLESKKALNSRGIEHRGTAYI